MLKRAEEKNPTDRNLRFVRYKTQKPYKNNTAFQNGFKKESNVKMRKMRQKATDSVSYCFLEKKTNSNYKQGYSSINLE